MPRLGAAQWHSRYKRPVNVKRQQQNSEFPEFQSSALRCKTREFPVFQPSQTHILLAKSSRKIYEQTSNSTSRLMPLAPFPHLHLGPNF